MRFKVANYVFLWFPGILFALTALVYLFTDFALILFRKDVLDVFHIVILVCSVLCNARFFYKCEQKYRGYAILTVCSILLLSYSIGKVANGRGQREIIANRQECPCIASKPIFTKGRGGGYYKFKCGFHYHSMWYETIFYPTKNLAVKTGDTLTVVFSGRWPEINFLKEFQKGVPEYEDGFRIN